MSNTKQQQDDTNFVALVMSLVTFFYGLFLKSNGHHLITRFAFLTISPLLENIFGWLFAIIAIIKILGIWKDIKPLKRLGIVGMIILWAIVVGIYLLEALKFNFFGLIFTSPILILCLRIARRGDYVE